MSVDLNEKELVLLVRLLSQHTVALQRDHPKISTSFEERTLSKLSSTLYSGIIRGTPIALPEYSQLAKSGDYPL